MSWEPPHDECGECRLFRKKHPNPRCMFCGAGEFFEPKDGEPVDRAILLMDDASVYVTDGRTPKESDVMDILSKDDTDE